MKSRFLLLTVASASLVIALWGCHSNSKMEDAKEKFGEAKDEMVEGTKEEVAKEYADFKASMEAQIETNNRKIEVLESKISDQSDATKEAYKAKIQDLKDKNAALKIRIQDYKTEQNNNWESFKREYKHDMD